MKILHFLFLTMLAAGLLACKESDQAVKNFQRITGQTMGTTYHISYRDELGRDLKAEIDRLLEEVNLEVSTYIEESTISRFNRGGRDFALGPELPEHFLENFRTSLQVYEATRGAYDPTVMPLVNYWGFGYAGRKKVSRVDSLKIDSLRHFVGLNKIRLEEGQPAKLQKELAEVQLDFSACAKGYAIDAVGNLLEQKQISDYMVEIGREVKVSGVSSRNSDWRIGIVFPEEGASPTELHSIVMLKDQAMATSGNYQNYYEVGGVRYAHTISPQTGYPERNSLLSASVFASECMVADAYATAFMVMGPQPALELAERLEGIEAFLICRSDSGGMEVLATSGVPGFEPVEE